MKAIIFDASTLISFSMNGLYDELRELKKRFNGKFIITKEVKKEIIDKPLTIKRFELEAIKLKELLDEGVLEMSSSLGINDKIVYPEVEKLKNIANATFKANNDFIYLVDSGEVSCLVVSKILTDRKIQNVVGVDERTIRMLGERPENLRQLFEKKLHVKISANQKNYKYFSGFKFIRSTELIYTAYKKGIIKNKNPMILDALLYAMKFKGCSISDDEIKDIERMKR